MIEKESYKDLIYNYEGKVVYIIDPLTMRVNIDLGFKNVLHHQYVKLADIELEDISEDKKKVIKDFLIEHVYGKYVVMKIKKLNDIRNGYYIIDLHYLKNQNDDVFTHLNAELVALKYAIPK